MALTKVRLGNLIEPIDERNDLGIREFYGVNINKEFMPTAANTEGLDESKYKVVRKNRFVFSGMQTGRDICIRIGLYEGDSPILVSPAYTTFEIERTDIVSPIYFFMRFLSKEMDRYGAFCSDGSIRSNLDWDVFCDIEIELPDLAAQERAVAVYRAMAENRESYERGLADLKLACDAYIDGLRNKYPLQKLGSFIELSEEKNDKLQYGADDVKGISIEKEFIDTKADMEGVSLRPYWIIKPDEFAYVTVTSRNGGKISLAHNHSSNAYICSSSYVAFKVSNTDVLLPSYLEMLFKRNEFDRYTRFHSWGSARETFGWDEMCDVKIPVPEISIQRAIVNIYEAYLLRKEIAERLREQIKNLCPILIKGSLADGAK